MLIEANAKPLSSVISVLLHGQTLQKSLNKLFNRGVYNPEDVATFDFNQIKQQAINDVTEITHALDNIKKELDQL